jgi:hypothetical protein
MAEPLVADADDSLAADLRRWLLSLPRPEVARLARFHLFVAVTSTALGTLVLLGDPAQMRASWLCSVALAWAAAGVYSRRLTLMREQDARRAIPAGGDSSPLRPERRDWWRDRNNVGD